MGIASIQVELPAATSPDELKAKIEELNADPACTGFLVQIPLPGQLDDGWALGLVDPAKDADGLHPMNLGRLVLGEPGPLPCTPRGLVELLRRNGIDLAGKVVCVIGRGTTVGRPLGLLLSRKSENATVILCHTGTVDVAAHTRQADVIVAAAGRPGLVTADMVKPGAVCVDVGITRTERRPGRRPGLQRARGRLVRGAGARRGGADDPGDAVDERGRASRGAGARVSARE